MKGQRFFLNYLYRGIFNPGLINSPKPARELISKTRFGVRCQFIYLMKSAKTKLKFFFPALALVFISSCKNTSDNIPFPENKTEFPQPVSRPFKFSEPWKINWSDSFTVVKPLVKKFDFNKLPVRIFDSTAFLPFPKKPEEVPFNWDKLPDTTFNYDELPSKPLKFVTSILEPPKLIKAGRPYLKNGTKASIYELEDEGLIGYITNLFEDRQGFMWIATDHGLYRYDGENLELYNVLSPNRNILYTMKEDSRGRIWVGGYNYNGFGIIVIDTKGGIINHLTEAQGLCNNNVVRMQSDNEGRIWISTFDGVNIIDENTHTIKYFGKKQGLGQNFTFGITRDGNNKMWIATNAGVNIIDLKNGKNKHLSKSNGLRGDTLTGIICDNRKRINLGTLDGQLNIVDPQQGKITHCGERQGLKKAAVFSLLDDNKGNIWIGTWLPRNNDVGIEIINPETSMIKTLKTSGEKSANNIVSLLRDSRNQIWVATSSGLNMLNKNGNDIEHIGKKEITTLAEDAHGQIWIGMEPPGIGVEILDTATGLARSLTTAYGLGNDTIQNMIEENGNIWIATNDGINIINTDRKTNEYLSKQRGLKSKSEPIMMKDKQGIMWLSSTTSNVPGVDALDLQKNTIHRLGITQGIKDTSIGDIKQDKKGQLWFITYTGGAYIINPGKNTMKNLDDAPGLKDHYRKLILPDEQGNVWIGTGKGIYIVNAKGDSIAAFSTREGLIDDNIISLHEYKGSVYAGTRGGVSIITPPSSSQKIWKVESFGRSQGINKLDNSFASDIITKKGLFLWGDMGITVLNRPTTGTVIPNTYVTGIDIFNQPQYFANKPWSYINENDTLWSNKKDTFYLEGQLPVNSSSLYRGNMRWDSIAGPYNMPVNLRLPYYQNYLQFHFAEADLGSQDTIWYSYLLQGVDKKWSDRTYNSYSQNYLNLRPGDYTFKVSGMFKGKWSEPAEFRFTINPPWWQTWWAYTIYVLIFVTLVWAFALYRSRKLQRENRMLEEKVVTRTHELKEEKEKVESTLQELKSTQARLIQSEKMASLGELTAGIAHEIQNPLNFVNNFSEVNKELIDEASQAIKTGNQNEALGLMSTLRDNEEKIIFHGKRADAIVKNMLQHSRTSAGQKEPTDINALADEYLRLSYHGMRAKDKTFNATMQTDFDENIGKINIVPQDIGRVLLNLYNNAFYAVNQKAKQQLPGKVTYEPTVSVTTKKVGERVEITVRDNGNGIPPKIADKIFQPFFTTKPTGEGTGLGLSLSYDIIKAHGGEMRVETQEESGSEFIIVLK